MKEATLVDIYTNVRNQLIAFGLGLEHLLIKDETKLVSKRLGFDEYWYYRSGSPIISRFGSCTLRLHLKFDLGNRIPNLWSMDCYHIGIWVVSILQNFWSKHMSSIIPNQTE